MKIEFGYEYFKTSSAELAVAAALDQHGDQVRLAADSGEPPLFVVAEHIAEYLFYPKLVRHADRMIHERLGADYKLAGRKPWPAKSGFRLSTCCYDR